MFSNYKYLLLINVIFFIGLLINSYHVSLVDKDNRNLSLAVEKLIVENNELKQIIANNNQAIYNRFLIDEKAILELDRAQILLAEGFVPLINENNELDAKLQEFLKKKLRNGNL